MLWFVATLVSLLYQPALAGPTVCPLNYTYSDQAGLCYRIIPNSHYWSDGQNLCTKSGGIMATIPNAFGNTFVLSMTEQPGFKCYDYWIGLTAFTSEEKSYGWIDGSKVSFTNWYPGKPVNHDSKYPVVKFNANDGLWVDTELSYQSCPICSAWPTFPLASQQACEPGWTFNDKTSSCYKPFISATWERAEANCNGFSAHLMSIHSNDENDFVISLTQTGLASLDPTQQVWIGALRSGNNWLNTDGTAYDYSHFGVGYPKPNNGNNTCVVLFSDPWDQIPGMQSYWQDSTCTQNERSYICKKKANL